MQRPTAKECLNFLWFKELKPKVVPQITTQLNLDLLDHKLSIPSVRSKHQVSTTLGSILSPINSLFPVSTTFQRNNTKLDTQDWKFSNTIQNQEMLISERNDDGPILNVKQFFSSSNTNKKFYVNKKMMTSYMSKQTSPKHSLVRTKLSDDGGDVIGSRNLFSIKRKSNKKPLSLQLGFKVFPNTTRNSIQVLRPSQL